MFRSPFIIKLSENWYMYCTDSKAFVFMNFGSLESRINFSNLIFTSTVRVSTLIQGIYLSSSLVTHLFG